MSERGGKRRDARERMSHERHDEHAERFSADGPGERGYRGSRAEDVPPGSVPGGSYGAGGGWRQGGQGSQAPDGRYGYADEFERGHWSGAPEHANDWRAGYGAYGVGREAPRRPPWGSNRRSDPRAMRSGYAEQGFGAGEHRRGNWGGGARGGYGGGEPGGPHDSRGGGWAAGEQRQQRGRGPQSYETWLDEPWTRSEFAGRGEFGSPPPGDWNEPGGYSTGAAPETWTPREHWSVPGPHSGRGPQGYRRAEAAIQEDVCDRLTRHGGLDASRITVHVENGEVTLEGYVESRTAKRMAEDTAESVSGVVDVHNRLRIGNTA